MTKTKIGLAEALAETLISKNEFDSNGEPANVVDGLFAIARAIGALADGVEGLRSDHPLQGETFGGLEDAIHAVAEAIRPAPPPPKLGPWEERWPHGVVQACRDGYSDGDDVIADETAT
jgi:hypothetical protein